MIVLVVQEVILYKRHTLQQRETKPSLPEISQPAAPPVPGRFLKGSLDIPRGQEQGVGAQSEAINTEGSMMCMHPSFRPNLRSWESLTVRTLWLTEPVGTEPGPAGRGCELVELLRFGPQSVILTQEESSVLVTTMK